MSYPNHLEDSSDDESNIWEVFGSIHRTLENEPPPSCVEDATSQLRLGILQPFHVPSVQPKTAWARTRARIMRLSGRTAGVEACVAWLQQTGQFSANELELIRRAKAFVEEPNGMVNMRSQGLDLALATAVLATLTFLAGIWIGWLLFSEQSGLQLVIHSFVVGSVLGFIAGRVLDKSFRFEKIREKIQAVAPCLVRGTVQ